ncbi:hypothetical protein BDV06DRAFT_220362 [Aspergillus oleicola]
MDNQGNDYIYCHDCGTWQLADQMLEEGEIYEPKSLPGAGVIDFNHEPHLDEYDEYSTESPIDPRLEYPYRQHQPQPNGLPETDQAEEMIAYSQRSQIAAGELQLQPQMQQQQQQQQRQRQRLFTEELPHESYPNIHQEIRRSQQLQADISESLARLEQARQGIAYHTQRLQHHFQQQQDLERHHRLRARRCRREQRRRAQQVQQQLTKRGIDIDSAQGQAALISSVKPTISPWFQSTISLLSRKLHEFVSETTGQVHPFFPKSVLALNLLSSAQLDELAIHYHQTYPPIWATFTYQNPVKPWLVTDGRVTDLGVDTAVKRRRFERFIGLKGADSPIRETHETDSVEQTRINFIEKDWEKKLEIARALKEQQQREAQAAAEAAGAAGTNVTFVHWKPSYNGY